jgi:hypothetical protein
MRQLPTYKGYTVDLKLKEFRKAIYGKTLEFLPFDSEKGQKLITEFLKTPEGKREYNETQLN